MERGQTGEWKVIPEKGPLIGLKKKKCGRSIGAAALWAKQEQCDLKRIFVGKRLQIETIPSLLWLLKDLID